jgi:hypothetical protein
MKNKVKTLAQFRASKRIVRRHEYIARYVDDSLQDGVEKVIVYGNDGDGFRIEILPDGKYYTQFERSEYIGQDLKRHEELFWDGFVKYELATPIEIEVDINERIIKFFKKNAERISYLNDVKQEVKELVERTTEKPGTFKDWLKSDNVIRVAVDRYQTQCTQYKKVFTKMELKAYYKLEYKNQ